MPTYLVNPPSQFVIPVTRGADLQFMVNRVDSNNNPVNWNAAVFIAVDAPDPNFPTTVQAAVNGNQAIILLPMSLNDEVNVRTKWRMYMQIPNGAGTLTSPVAVGHFERDDGSAP
jgi:hypothetical protein